MFSTSIDILEQLAAFTHARHDVLAGNVANLDTPGYRVRDLPPEQFHAQLKEALAARRAPSSGGRSDPGLAAARPLETILHHDDSNVGLEQQINELNKNHVQHHMAITLLRSQFSLLQAAITLRP